MCRAILCTMLLLPLIGLGTGPQKSALSRLTGEVIDSVTSKPLPARIYIQGEDGTWHFPRSASAEGIAIPYKKQRGDRSIEMHTTLSAHPFIVDLPPGKYTVTLERGHAYHLLTSQIIIGKTPFRHTFKLRRWIDMAQRGWFSGETHVHRSLEELPTLMLAEDLNVGLPMSYWVTEAYAPPRTNARSTAKEEMGKLIRVDDTHVIYPRNTEYELFTIGKKPHTLGAFFIINHKTVFDKGAPPVRAIAEQAHAEGASIELDKPNWPWSMMLIALMNVDLYELANNHVWRTEFGFPDFGEPPPDYMKVEKDARGLTERGWLDFNFQNYYALLNCGFKLRPTAGTASGVHPVPLGFGRVYVHLDKGFSYDAWIKGLNAGRSFVTTGPMMFVQVESRQPGHTFQQPANSKKVYRVTGAVVSGRPLQRIEIIVNGEIAQSLKPKNQRTEKDGYDSPLDAVVSVDSSSWIAVRCFEDRADKRVRFAHSAPVHIEVANKALRPRKVEVDFLVKRVEDQLNRNRGVLPEAAMAEYEEALRVYQKIAKTAR